MKKFLTTTILLFAIFFSSFTSNTINAVAYNETIPKKDLTFDNVFYIETVIEDVTTSFDSNNIMILTTTKNITKSKTVSIKNANHALTSSKKQNTATATAVATYSNNNILKDYSKSVTITCSKDGIIS